MQYHLFSRIVGPAERELLKLLGVSLIPDGATPMELGTSRDIQNPNCGHFPINLKSLLPPPNVFGHSLFAPTAKRAYNLNHTSEVAEADDISVVPNMWISAPCW